jgi:hypothetical protein
MSISSTGLYGSASIVNSDVFNDVESLKEQVTTLSTSYLDTTREHRIDISQNRLDISQNRLNISQNRLDISQNTLDISQNRLDISQNRLDISQNTLDISQNRQDKSQNRFDISQNRLDTSQNTLDIYTYVCMYISVRMCKRECVVVCKQAPRNVRTFLVQM